MQNAVAIQKMVQGDPTGFLPRSLHLGALKNKAAVSIRRLWRCPA
jgi:hypothetical protein